MRRSSPGAQVSPALCHLFSPPLSASLCLILLPPTPTISSFAVSYTLMVFLLISLPAVPVFHLPPHNQIAWAVTAQIHPPPAPPPRLTPPPYPFPRLLLLSPCPSTAHLLSTGTLQSLRGTLCNSREREREGGGGAARLFSRLMKML